MLLREIQGTPTGLELASTMKTLILNEMEAAAPILRYAQFYTFTGMADNIPTEATANAGAFRNLNSEPDTATTVYANELNVPLKILSARVRTDRAYQDRGLDLNGEHMRQIKAEARNLGYRFMDFFINSDGSNGSITGLRNNPIVQEIIFDTQNGGSLEIGSDNTAKKQYAKFLETLDNVILQVPNGANVLVMNAAMASRISTIFREYTTYSSITSATGDTIRIQEYKGIPIVISGVNANNQEVIGFDYNVGDKSNTTAIYAIRFEERDMVSFATTKSGLYVQYNPNVSNFVQTDIELQYNLVVIRPKAAIKLVGIYW